MIEKHYVNRLPLENLERLFDRGAVEHLKIVLRAQRQGDALPEQGMIVHQQCLDLDRFTVQEGHLCRSTGQSSTTNDPPWVVGS